MQDLLDTIAASGWLVSNLFQLNDGSWQANLRNASHFTQFGRGASPTEALSAAIDRMDTAEAYPTQQSFDRAAPKPSLDLRALLGLKRPTLIRRI